MNRDLSLCKRYSAMSKLAQAYDPEAFRQQGHALINQLADYLQAQLDRSEHPVLPTTPPQDQYRHWEQLWTNEGGRDLAEIMPEVLDQSLHLHHPRNLGHQVSAPVPISALAGLVSSLLNNGMAIYETGPVGSAMEELVVKKLAEALGLDSSSGGFLTQGGTLANFTGLLAARHHRARQRVWQEGMTRPLALMVSAEAHYCVDRAARILGWGEDGVILIPSDEQYRMRSDLLPEYLKKAQSDGKEVIAVVGSACSTSTGSYDDLEAIADFCEAENLWFHVDGAHGVPAGLSPTYRHLVRGLDRADSVVVDFHKMMMMPATLTALLFKRDADSYRTFAQKAHYLWSEDESPEWYNYGKRNFECTKRMMSLIVYATWQQHGTELFVENVETCYGLAQTFARMIEQTPDFELALQPQANIVCFRYCTEGLSDSELSALNAATRAQAIQQGAYYLVQTRLNGEVWLRSTLMNPFTSESDLRGLLHRLAMLAKNAIAG